MFTNLDHVLVFIPIFPGHIPWNLPALCFTVKPKPGKGRTIRRSSSLRRRSSCQTTSTSFDLTDDGAWGRSSLHDSFFPRASERRVLPIVGVCKTSSHLHTFSSSHLLIFTSSHLHIFSSSHLHIFSSSSHHLLIFRSSHLHISLIFSHLLSSSLIFSHLLTSSHIFSHLLTSSHIFSHLLTSSHIFSHLLTSSHIFSHLLTSSHIFSHLLSSSLIFSHLLTSSHIFSHLLTSSHIFTHIFSSSHLTSSHLALLPSCPVLLFYFSFEGGSRDSANETARNTTLSHEMRVDRQKLR